MFRLGVGEDGYIGAEAGRDGMVVAVGRINGFKEQVPEGKRRILRCRDLACISVSGGSGSPQEAVPSEEADWIDVGLEEDGTERNRLEAPESRSTELNCLEPRFDTGDTISSSCIAVALVPSEDSEMLEVDPKLLACRNADSDTVDKDDPTPPGEKGTRGSIDLGRGVLLCRSALLGEEFAEESSSLVGDRTSRLVNTSILLSKSTLTASNPSASLTLVR